MVDFNNDTTITRPRQDIINFIILQRRQDTIDKYIEYKISTIKRGAENINKLSTYQAYLSALFLEIRSMLQEGWDKIKNNPYQQLQELELDIESDNTEKIIRAWIFIDTYLYRKGLIKTDTKEIQDRTDIFEMNRKFLS